MSEQEKVYKSSRLNTSKENEKSINIPSTTKETYNMSVLQAKLDSGILSSRDVMQLQKTIGNKATMQLLNNNMNTSSIQKKEDKNNINKVDYLSNQVMQKKENNTGLPDNLKTGVENLSGISLDNVKVHYNSDKPAQIGALAYTQGTDIHVGPEQEKHLPHEAWHVVQQAQGRVRPTIQMKNFQVNDDVGLEKEADEMSGKINSTVTINHPLQAAGNSNTHTLQCVRINPTLNNMIMTPGPWPTDEINTDTVACVPTNLWKYEAEHPAVSGNKMDALENIRQEYRSIGMGIQHRFLSADYAKSQAKSDNTILDIIYDKYAQTMPAQFNIDAHNRPQRKIQIINLLENKTMPDASIITPGELRDMLNHLRNMGNLNMTDPFHVSLTARYVGGTIKHTVEFSEGQKGYISKVEDTQTNIDSTMERRTNYAGEYPGLNRGDSAAKIAEGALLEDCPTFSSVHHTTTNIDARTQIAGINGASKLSKEQGIDAMTKVVAEGGRFDCVAALNQQGSLQANSLFYTQLPGPPGPDPKFRVMRFDVLWKYWSSYFGSKYGITNAVVADELRKDKGIEARKGVVKQATEPPAIGYHYNLDTSTVR